MGKYLIFMQECYIFALLLVKNEERKVIKLKTQEIKLNLTLIIYNPINS